MQSSEHLDAYGSALRAHYERNWGREGHILQWQLGPIDELPAAFRIIEFPPTRSRALWTYATVGMAQPGDAVPIEAHLLAPQRDVMHVELLTVLAHYHRTGEPLNVGHTVRFGRPWIAGSLCERGLLSLPHLDGPSLEVFSLTDAGLRARCLWLIPVTPSEVEFAIANGLDALEHAFERSGFDYADPYRAPVE